MKKKSLKKAVSLFLAMLMLCGCMMVSAEETTYAFYDVSAEGETTLRTWDGELSGASKASSSGQTFVWFNTGNYVVFRANVLETGIYDISLGWGASSAGARSFSVSIDDGEAKVSSPEYAGLGNFVPEYKSVATEMLSKGEHTIKVEATAASGAFMAIKLNCVAKQIELLSLSADGVEEITGESSYVSQDTENIVIKLSEEVNPETVNDENIILTYDGGQSVSVTPLADGNAIYIPVKGKLEVGKTYTLIADGIKDNYNYFGLAEIFANFEVKEKTYTYVNLAESGETTIKAASLDQSDRLKPDGTAMNFEYSAVSFQNNYEMTYRVYNETSGVYELFLGLGSKSSNTFTFALTVDGKAQNVQVTTAGGSGNQVSEYISALTLKLDAGKHTIKVKSVGASLYFHGIKLSVLSKGIAFKNIKADGTEITEEVPYVSVETENLAVEFSETINPETVTTETVKLTYGESGVLEFVPSAAGKVVTIPVEGKLANGEVYTLTLEGVKDSYNFSTLTKTEVQFTVYNGSYSSIKCPDIVIEAEDFTEAGYYLNGDVKDETAVTVGTTADGTKYVELDNMDYIKIPYTISAQSHYRIELVYASDSNASVSVAYKYQETFPQTGDLETFKTYEPSDSSHFYSATSIAYLRPGAMSQTGKFRIDKVIFRRGQTINADGTVAIRRLHSEKDGNSEEYVKQNVTGTPVELYKGRWVEYIFHFPESGYYNFSTRANTYKGNALNFVISSDDVVIGEKNIVASEGLVGYDNSNALDLGTYYFDKGYHIIKLSNTGTTYTYAYELFAQKTDLLDGKAFSPIDSTDYSEGITLNYTTKVEAGQYINTTVEAAEDGYYSIYAMLSSAEVSRNINATIDSDEYSVAIKKINTKIAGYNPNLKMIQNTKIADVYLIKGTHSVKLSVPEDGSAIGVSEVSLYQPQIEAVGIPVSEALVRLNGLFSGKATEAVLAVYKEKEGIVQLAGIDYKNVDSAKAGTVFDLATTDITFEEGYDYFAKIFILNNMTGVVKEYTETAE